MRQKDNNVHRSSHLVATSRAARYYTQLITNTEAPGTAPNYYGHKRQMDNNGSPRDCKPNLEAAGTACTILLP